MAMALERIKDFGLEKIAWVGLRLGLGWIMLWAFLDKTFGLGYATASENSWLNGGSPTSGYLNYATTGPLAGLYQDLAGNTAVDVLFMAGLLLAGVALILGIGVRIASIGGSFLMLLLWSSRLPPENNPIIDDHIIYIVALLGIAWVGAGKWLGLGKWWAQTKLVKRFPFLE